MFIIVSYISNTGFNKIMPRSITNYFVTTVLLIYSTGIYAAAVYTSSDIRISLLELYTSEGCSSCPPADRWLSKLKKDNRLWKELIPVAFHVDYWNHIGWNDRFSSRKYSDRQRNYARSKNFKTVYTPGFLLNGEEWRSFFGLRIIPTSNEKVGTLTLNLDSEMINAEYVPIKSKNVPLELNIALLGFDLHTDVKAGENRGKQLKHDFVVLGYKTVLMQPNGNSYIISSKLPEISITAPRSGIVAWVSEENDQSPIQVVGGWINKQE